MTFRATASQYVQLQCIAAIAVIFDEPTRGVDVGAILEIHTFHPDPETLQSLGDQVAVVARANAGNVR